MRRRTLTCEVHLPSRQLAELSASHSLILAYLARWFCGLSFDSLKMSDGTLGALLPSSRTSFSTWKV